MCTITHRHFVRIGVLLHLAAYCGILRRLAVFRQTVFDQTGCRNARLSRWLVKGVSMHGPVLMSFSIVQHVGTCQLIDVHEEVLY